MADMIPEGSGSSTCSTSQVIWSSCWWGRCRQRYSPAAGCPNGQRGGDRSISRLSSADIHRMRPLHHYFLGGFRYRGFAATRRSSCRRTGRCQKNWIVKSFRLQIPSADAHRRMRSPAPRPRCYQYRYWPRNNRGASTLQEAPAPAGSCLGTLCPRLPDKGSLKGTDTDPLLAHP
jgi:hypothetical protein